MASRRKSEAQRWYHQAVFDLQAAKKILSATTAYYPTKQDASFFETRNLAENFSSREVSSG
jgi:hypothetical protein